MSNIFKAEILGQEFTLKGELEVPVLERVSRFLEERIQEVQQQLPGANKVHVSVLAALNIAYEYFLLKEELDLTLKTLETKGQQWIAKLEAGVSDQSSAEV